MVRRQHGGTASLAIHGPGKFMKIEARAVPCPNYLIFRDLWFLWTAELTILCNYFLKMFQSGILKGRLLRGVVWISLGAASVR